MGFGAAISLIDMELRAVKLMHQFLGSPENPWLDGSCECTGLSLQVWCLIDNSITTSVSANGSNDQRIAAICILAAITGGAASACQAYMILQEIPDPDALLLAVVGNLGDFALSSTALGLLSTYLSKVASEALCLYF
jgi:hypothetical protein